VARHAASESSAYALERRSRAGRYPTPPVEFRGECKRRLHFGISASWGYPISWTIHFSVEL